jgi:hypothetical protein
LTADLDKKGKTSNRVAKGRSKHLLNLAMLSVGTSKLVKQIGRVIVIREIDKLSDKLSDKVMITNDNTVREVIVVDDKRGETHSSMMPPCPHPLVLSHTRRPRISHGNKLKFTTCPRNFAGSTPIALGILSYQGLAKMPGTGTQKFLPR